MSTDAAPLGRVLVVVSNDYGELGAALYFLQGCPLASRPRVLLPSALAHALDSGPQAEVAVYRGAADVQAQLHAYRPDTVLLATGYLLAMGVTGIGLLPAWRLLRMMTRRGIRLLTTDPFLGIRPSPLRLLWADLRQRTKRDALWAAVALAPATWLLRRAWHVYPAPVQRLPVLGGDARCRSYRGTQARLPDPLPGQPPSWLFVLSALEMRMLDGASQGRWVELLVLRLRECQRAGRLAVLVGPTELTRRVAHQLPAGPLLQLHSALSYPAYMQHLLAAERVFFWNMLSFSILHRVLAAQPAHFFDAGHLARIHPPFWQAGVRLFYGGWHPPVLDLQQPLLPERLAPVTADTLRAFSGIAQGLQALPDAAALLAGLELQPPPRPRRSR